MTERQRQVNKKIDRFYQFSAISFLVSLAGVSIFIISWTVMSSPTAVATGLAMAKPYLAVWRGLLFCSLIGGWPTLIHCLTCWSEMGPNQIRMLQDYRWRMALWLMVIELLLTQQVLAVFFQQVLR